MKPANTMEHTERHGRHGGILYPLLLVAAIAVIVFSIIGIATMTGLMSSAAPRDGAAAKSEADSKGKPARIETPRREPASKTGSPRTATFYEGSHPALRPGQRVSVMNDRFVADGQLEYTTFRV